jgi:hypothetical protein
MEYNTIEFIDNLPVCTGTKVKKCITGVATLLYWRKKRKSIYQYVPAKNDAKIPFQKKRP